MFFSPLNLDRNPRSLEGKCGIETVKINEETKVKDFLQLCSNSE